MEEIQNEMRANQSAKNVMGKVRAMERMKGRRNYTKFNNELQPQNPEGMPPSGSNLKKLNGLGKGGANEAGLQRVIGSGKKKRCGGYVPGSNRINNAAGGGKGEESDSSDEEMEGGRKYMGKMLAKHLADMHGGRYLKKFLKGEHYVNGDGIRFPPVKYKVGEKVYWGLPCCGGKPEGRTRVYDAEEGRRGAKTKHKNRERIRRSMLFFRSDKMPNFTHLPEFSTAAAYERGATYTKNPEKQYRGVVIRKRYNGVELIGTDRVMAKGSKGKRESRENAEAPIPIESMEDAPFQASLQGIRNAPEVAPFQRDEPLPEIEAEQPRIRVRRRRAETGEEELARVKAAYDEWRAELSPTERHATQVRFRNYAGKHGKSAYVGDRAMSEADAYRKTAATGTQASKITIP